MPCHWTIVAVIIDTNTNTFKLWWKPPTRILFWFVLGLQYIWFVFFLLSQVFWEMKTVLIKVCWCKEKNFVGIGTQLWWSRKRYGGRECVLNGYPTRWQTGNKQHHDLRKWWADIRSRPFTPHKKSARPWWLNAPPSVQLVGRLYKNAYTLVYAM